MLKPPSAESPGVGNSEDLLVLVTTLDDGGRKAAIAFGVALAALAQGTNTYVFLSLESARLGAPTGAEGVRPRGFSESMEEYIQHFLDLGGTLEVCSSCYEEYCRSMPKDESGRPRLRPGTRIETLAIVAERATTMRVVTF
jgi:predicted peroxiredoxin